MAKLQITQSVGLGGANKPNDVKAVQTALNQILGQIPLTKKLVVDGKLGTKPENSKTVAAIKAFQKKVVGMVRPDGKIDANGRSHKKLNTTLGNIKPVVTTPAAGKASTYFAWKEFACHDNDKTPVPTELRPSIKTLAGQLDVLRKELGKPIKINSAYRTPEHNRKVGGTKNSLHVQAKAADIAVSGMAPKEVHAKVLELIASKKMADGGLGLYNTFVHYDVRGYKARW
ncbi:hypothetical protein AHAT_11860 [Agarivorans sp. Toyoura001]|uniref:D-Ala-D-Ala carboxypeptidase family metallohydrolase n=1 Tax=Agarivorans sp. Toyoura001 TaxID=2283141 RepID=UPI0010D375FE|nr:D-Ala-D-Ala carboxypeptidase family metallohydrolase [Agarivorans sp. Toyoura001]GDY25296.1 hypothetical protein AHAT_11860 [Agarivorans sp. Toyoura001]